VHVKQLENNILWEKKQQSASEESEDISCSWLRSQISKPENQAISAQYSKQISLQFSYSRKIQVLPTSRCRYHGWCV